MQSKRALVDVLAITASSSSFIAAADCDNCWPLGLLSIVILFARARGSAHAMSLALAAFSASFVVLWFPVCTALSDSFALDLATSVGVFAVAVLWQAAPYAIWVGLSIELRCRQACWLASSPLLLVVIEEWFPAIIDYRVAVVMIDCHPIAQAAEVGGSAAVGALLALCACCTADVVAQRRLRPRHLVVIGVVFAVATLGAARAKIVDTARQAAPLLDVALLNPNFGRQSGSERIANAGGIVVAMRRATDQALSRGVDLVVWPETVWPYILDRSVTREFEGWHPWALRESTRGHVVFGALTGEVAVPDSPVYNSVVWFDEMGHLAAIHDKKQLVPFFEYMPLEERFDWMTGFRTRYPEWPRIAPGSRTESGAKPKACALGLLCCSEELTPSVVCKQVQRGAQLLVSVGSNSWFQSPSISRQHAKLARLRAIEARRDLVRSVHAGVSGAVDATGRVLAAEMTSVVDASSRAGVPSTVVVSVPMLDIPTVGPIVVPLFRSICLALCAGLVAWSRLRAG